MHAIMVISEKRLHCRTLYHVGRKMRNYFANSVNVLQDKMANEMLGLLGMGARVGQWAKLTNILESHITGDPTLRFQSINEVDANALFKEPYSESRMLELLQSPYADIQNFALHNLYRNDYPGISDLLRKTFETSSFMMVRFTCLALLEKISDKTSGKSYTWPLRIPMNLFVAPLFV